MSADWTFAFAKVCVFFVVSVPWPHNLRFLAGAVDAFFQDRVPKPRMIGRVMSKDLSVSSKLLSNIKESHISRAKHSSLCERLNGEEEAVHFSMFTS